MRILSKLSQFSYPVESITLQVFFVNTFCSKFATKYIEKEKYVDITERIKELCSKNNMSVRALERRLGFGNGYFGRLNGRIPSDRLQMVAAYFRISPEELLGTADETYTVAVTDDSMAPDLTIGTTLVVQPQTEASSGDVVIVRQNGTERVRRLMAYHDALMLIAFNPAYPPMLMPEDAEIVGKVIESRRKW